LVTLEALVARYPQSARAWIALADIRQSLGNTEGGLTALQKLTENSPQHLPLVAHSLAQWARVCKRIDWARALLSSYQNTHVSSLDVTQALVTLSPDLNTGRQLYIQHLQQEPSLVAATLWLAGTRFGTEDEEKKIKAALERAGEPLKRYRCAACGFEARQYFWHCPGCQGWDSYPPRRIEEL
jgi:lipopolysaccharide biosynthesis regulator YciM